MTTPPPRPRTWRIPAAALVVAGILTGLLGTTTPALADPWSDSATRVATVTAATLGSALQLTSGAGTVTADGSQYSISAVLGSVTGYVALTNTSTVPATISVVVATGSLIASTPATVCTLPWVLPAGTCPGTSTLLAQNATYATPALVDRNASVYLRVQSSGVLGGITLTTSPVVPRGPADRTAS